MKNDLPRVILAGDVGGTNTRLALYQTAVGRLQYLSHENYPCVKYESFEQIIDEFLSSRSEKIDAACIGVAGPVLQGRCDATNLPWVLDESELAAHLHLSTVLLINDLEAAAHGVLALDDNDFVELNPHAYHNPAGNRAVIAAGTGLGEAVIFRNGDHFYPFATEGGHCDFAPTDSEQDRLLSWLRERWGEHVSYERVVSGPGLVDIYRWLLDSGQHTEQGVIKDAMRTGDPASVISEAALAGKDDNCVSALQLFVRIYAQETGNLVLKSFSTGGVYLGGGIAPKILPALQSDNFMHSWLNKGRFSGLLKSIPVKVVQHPQVALIGAASYLLHL